MRRKRVFGKDFLGKFINPPRAGDKKRFYSKKSSNKENKNPQLPKNFESSKEKFLRPKKINSL